jgi:hypothetical protein
MNHRKPLQSFQLSSDDAIIPERWVSVSPHFAAAHNSKRMH